MVTNYHEVPINDLIAAAAKELQSTEQIQPPEWAAFVKTAAFKERPPVDKNWWYIRSAAILLSVEKLGPIGVSKLRTKYGGKGDRGVRPEHHGKAAGNIIRTVLQQLEAAGLIKQQEKGVYKGRVITPKGKSLLSRSAKKIK